MPVAILLSDQGVVPAVMYEDSAEALVARLAGLPGAPALTSEQEARLWLQSHPEPSGWFCEINEAAAHVRRFKEDAPILSGAKVKAARDALGLSRFAFGQAIGMGGNQNTVNKSIAEIETEAEHRTTGKKRVLNPSATRRLIALLAEKRLEKVIAG